MVKTITAIIATMACIWFGYKIFQDSPIMLTFLLLFITYEFYRYQNEEKEYE